MYICILSYVCMFRAYDTPLAIDSHLNLPIAPGAANIWASDPTPRSAGALEALGFQWKKTWDIPWYYHI